MADGKKKSYPKRLAHVLKTRMVPTTRVTKHSLDVLKKAGIPYTTSPTGKVTMRYGKNKR